MKTKPPADVEYRFNATAAEHVCPVCERAFQQRIGCWPFIRGTSTPVCGDTGCMVEDEPAYGPPVYDTRFAFTDLSPATVRVVRATAAARPAVDEALREAALQPDVSDRDGTVLQLAAIDLEFCDADQTRIESFEPVLVIRTCPEAAAEMLLSGCGEIVRDDAAMAALSAR